MTKLHDTAASLAQLAEDYPHPQTKAVLLGCAAKIYEHLHEAQLAQEQQNADRYLWIRAQPISMGRNRLLIENTGERLDAAIDTARGAL